MLVNLKVFIVEFKSLVKNMMKHSHHLIPKRGLKMIDKRFLDINAYIHYVKISCKSRKQKKQTEFKEWKKVHFQELQILHLI